MTKKNTFFGLTGAVLQLLTIIAGFIPIISRIDEYIFDPFAGDFLFEKTIRKYSLFFDPSKLDISAAAANRPVKGVPFIFAVLFLAFGAVAIAFSVLSVIKNKKASIAVTSSVFALFSLLISVFAAGKFCYEIFTWRYIGGVSAGVAVVIVLQIFALTAFILSARQKT